MGKPMKLILILAVLGSFAFSMSSCAAPETEPGNVASSGTQAPITYIGDGFIVSAGVLIDPGEQSHSISRTALIKIGVGGKVEWETWLKDNNSYTSIGRTYDGGGVVAGVGVDAALFKSYIFLALANSKGEIQ